MYEVKIRDHIMIAHSLPRDFFGPAANLHGATFVVDVIFYSEELNEYEVVIDIGRAHSIVKEVLAELNYENLDEKPEFSGKLTTTEHLARYIHDSVSERAAPAFQGPIKVTLGESHVAWASYSSLR